MSHVSQPVSSEFERLNTMKSSGSNGMSHPAPCLRTPSYEFAWWRNDPEVVEAVQLGMMEPLKRIRVLIGIDADDDQPSLDTGLDITGVQ